MTNAKYCILLSSAYQQAKHMKWTMNRFDAVHTATVVVYFVFVTQKCGITFMHPLTPPAQSVRRRINTFNTQVIQSTHITIQNLKWNALERRWSVSFFVQPQPQKTGSHRLGTNRTLCRHFIQMHLGSALFNQ